MKKNSISERWKEDTDGEQDLCRVIVVVIWRWCSPSVYREVNEIWLRPQAPVAATLRVRVGAICSPSDGLCNQGSALRSCKGDSAGAAAYYRGLTKTLSTRPAVTDEVKWLCLIYSPSCQSKDEFYFGLHGLVSPLSVKAMPMVSHCFIWHLATAKKI